MQHRLIQLAICALVVCCLTGCPEGFMSEGITDNVCRHNLAGTTWVAPCHDSEIILSFVSCDLWTATYDSVQTYGFYTVDAHAIIGELLANEQPDSSFCCIGNAKTFVGDIESERLVVGDHTFTKQ